MKPAPFLLGAVLLFWGWQTGLLFLGVILAVILEGSRLVRARWEFSQADLTRIWNLCSILFLGAAVISFTVYEGASGMAGLFDTGSMAKRSDALNKTSHSVLVLFQWMPLIFFPIAAVQAFSARDTMDLSIFSWVWRRRKAKQATSREPARPSVGINVLFPYAAGCLLASSAANQRTAWFYFGVAVLLAWSLWSVRNKRFSWVVWCGLLAAVVAFGYAGHHGLYRLQKALENLDATFLSDLFKQEFNPKESRTSIGHIGRLKLSGRIVLRLETDGQPPPTHLRETCYDQFNFKESMWSVAKKDFSPVVSENDGTTWQLLPQKNSRKSVTVARYLPRGAGLLALPNGVSELRNLPVGILKSNRLGVVSAETGPGLVRYQAQYDEGPAIDSPPTDADRDVPPAEAEALAQIADELKLFSQSATQVLQTVAAFFQERFRYSTYLNIPGTSTPRQSALGAFLLKHRAGHCEYFATATVLLLRQAKIPARYVAGYSVQERSGRNYIVRERHAHAWCLVFVDGVWREFDTTPPSWHEVESQNASFWEPFSDAWSRLWFEFSKWRWGKGGFKKYIAWLLLPLVLLLAARLFFKKQWRRFRQEQKKRAARSHPGMDSEFYLVERKLVELGLERNAGETLSAWLDRIESSAPAAPPLLRRILSLHYRHRFDPEGLSTEERQALKSEVAAWLEQNRKGLQELAKAKA